MLFHNEALNLINLQHKITNELFPEATQILDLLSTAGYGATKCCGQGLE